MSSQLIVLLIVEMNKRSLLIINFNVKKIQLQFFCGFFCVQIGILKQNSLKNRTVDALSLLELESTAAKNNVYGFLGTSTD